MNGVVLPGNSTVRHVTLDVPEPGSGQVLLAMKASSICGSDIRAIYREHLGHGPEAYQDVVAGHEPAGQVVAVGPACRRLEVGDRPLLDLRPLAHQVFVGPPAEHDGVDAVQGCQEPVHGIVDAGLSPLREVGLVTRW